MNVDRARLDRALNPRSVVVVGDKGPHYMWLSNLSEFEGPVYSVQLDEKEIPGILEKGIENFSSLTEIPGEVDLVICAVPRQVTPYIVADAVKKEVGGVAMFTSGFVETGDEVGARLQEQIVAAAREAGLPLVGPNCMGVYNRRLGVKFGQGQEKGQPDEDGHLSIISQSGTHGISITAGMQALGIRVTRTISIGNAAVLNETDYLEYLRDDPDTPVIVMYLEGVRDGRQFASLLRKVTREKPVVIWRGGRTSAGARAAASHTASLASDDAIWSALMRQAGAISTDSAEETLDVAQALVRMPRSDRRGLALIAMTGGQSVAITDQFARAGFEVPELSQQSYDRLAEFFVTIGGSYRNPFDASSTIGREDDNLAKILDILADDANIEGVALEMQARDFEKGTERLDGQIGLLRSYQERTQQPVVAIMPEGGFGAATPGILADARVHVGRAGFATYASFARAAIAFGRVRDYWAWRGEVGC
ncbi:MAG: CoA-binding protein [Dehalococcoidia bacterium]|nr:CoA-binding protein [Dehalococcoidia bacterium]